MRSSPTQKINGDYLINLTSKSGENIRDTFLNLKKALDLAERAIEKLNNLKSVSDGAEENERKGK